MKCYVINLDRHAERWERFAAMLARYGLAAERISAVDALRHDEAYFDAWLARRPKYALSSAEIACTLSHRIAWRRFLDEGSDYCAVFEDDIEFGGNLGRFTNSADWIPRDADIVKLETFAYTTFVKASGFHVFGRDLKRLGAAHHGTAAYVINRRAAGKLLKLTERIDRTTDDIMFDVRAIHFQRLRIYQLDPAVCVQYSRLHAADLPGFLSSSVVPMRALAKRRGFGKLRAEVNRPFRRLASFTFIGTPLRLAGFRKTAVKFVA